MNDIDSINHIGMAVRRIAPTAARYEAMGFALTPYSPHSGAWKPGEAVRPMGSGNRCVMFERNYLEILISEDESAPAPRLAGYLAHHQGAHIVCFNSEDVHALDGRLTAQGIRTSGVIPLQRDIDTAEGVRTAKFERVQIAPDDSPEGYIQAARHLTPQYIYQPRYLGHANGCTALSSGTIVTDDLDRFADKYARYTGIAPQREDGAVVFRFPLLSRLVLVDTRDAGRHLPGTLLPPIPGIAAVGFACPDLASQAKRLAQAGIPFGSHGDRLIVPAEEAGGVAVVFESARSDA